MPIFDGLQQFTLNTFFQNLGMIQDNCAATELFKDTSFSEMRKGKGTRIVSIYLTFQKTCLKLP